MRMAYTELTGPTNVLRNSSGRLERRKQRPPKSPQRYVKLFREGGAASFFAPVKKRSASKLTTEVCRQAQELLDQELEVPEVGRQLGILSNTLHKAIRAGRLRPGKKKLHPTMS